MPDAIPLEDVGTPMRCGFLADNVVRLLREGGARNRGEPSESEQAKSEALEFLKAVMQGLENFGRSSFEEGGIGGIVESVTLYGYATQALPHLPLEEKGRFREQIAELQQICERWIANETLQQEERLKLSAFFSAIAEVTLNEANKVLTPGRGQEPKWPLSRNSVTH